MTGSAAILVAATHSGAGKTTATGVLLRALRDRGLSVRAFKVGPDFIDTGYLTEATGRPAINLDVWMMGEEGVRRSFERWSVDVDVSVIESMGALYDGADCTEHGSAAHVAKLLDVPVVVVLDVWGMTRTAGAILEGLRAFDPATEIAGCVLNRVGSPAHAAMVTASLSPPLRALVVGAIEQRADLHVPERHLGVVTVDENPSAKTERETARTDAARSLDIDHVVTIAGATAGTGAPRTSSAVQPVARMAIARDKAFSFYYEENLELLRDAGFELVPFRPTSDRVLPADIDAVYIGGGYPESFAAELEANSTLADELRERTADGMPLYAECGGLLYLGRSLTGFDGVRHTMAGVLPFDALMDSAHLAIRYVEVRTRTASPLGEIGAVARGQEFHQSRIVNSELDPTLYDVTTSSGKVDRTGYVSQNIVASYIHLHFGSNPNLASKLRHAAVEARGSTSTATASSPASCARSSRRSTTTWS